MISANHRHSPPFFNKWDEGKRADRFFVGQLDLQSRHKHRYAKAVRQVKEPTGIPTEMSARA